MHLQKPFYHAEDSNQADIIGLKVGKSKIQNAGSGVFATKDFAKDELIVDFSYQEISDAQLRKRYDYKNVQGQNVQGVAPYGLNLKLGGKSGDAACTRNIASFVNDGYNPNPRLAKSANVEFFLYMRPRELWLRATQNIKKGDELYVNYGKEYWSNINEIIKGHQQKRVRVSPGVSNNRENVIMWVDAANRGGRTTTQRGKGKGSKRR
jgi:hypothetical protein